MNKLRVFIGSSEEALIIAQVLEEILRDAFQVALWKDIFAPGEFFLESLEKQKNNCDFAVFILTPDDKLIYHGRKLSSPRDNLIFELGLFIGSIGRKKTFIVSDRKTKLPSDISGINILFYSTYKYIDFFKKLILKITNPYQIINVQEWTNILNEPAETLKTKMNELGSFKKTYRGEIQALIPKESPFQLIESFPVDGQRITTDDVKRIYLKFNNPVDRSTVPYIGNLFIQANTFCQWNICGWIEFAEDDKKLIWHVHERNLLNKNYYGPLEIDYPRFEIHVGREPDEWRVKDTSGNELPKTNLRVFIQDK